MADPPRCVAFGSDRGGVGKSKAAELYISRHLLQHGRLPLILEVESDPRLLQIYGAEAVRLFRVAQDRLADLERNPALVYRLWDAVGEACLQASSEVVLDLGANMTRPFALWLNEYGEEGPFGAGGGLAFYGVTTGDLLAVQSVNQALGYVAQAVPEAQRHLVINEKEAQFPLASEAPVIREMAQRHGLRQIHRLPACLSPALSHVVDRQLRLDEAVEKPVEWWQAECGMPRLEAVRARRRLVSFLDDGIRMFDAAAMA